MLIYALVNNQTLRERVESVATALGYDVRWELSLTEIISTVADTRPAAILVDLNDDTTHWQQIVWALKTNPATRRLGVVGFAVELEPALQQQALSLLVDDVFAAQDTLDLPPLQTLADRLKAYARVTDDDLQAILANAAKQPIPNLVVQGLNEFNAREFYEAHETLEHAWMDEAGPIRDMYRGILQIAVAYYHILRGNYRGAQKMFLRSIQWMQPLPDECQGINIAKLREDAAGARRHLEELGPDGISNYDTSLLKTIEFDPTFGHGA